jgi:hypothetical protein
VGNKIAGRMGGLYESMSLTTIFAINTVVPWCSRWFSRDW